MYGGLFISSYALKVFDEMYGCKMSLGVAKNKCEFKCDYCGRNGHVKAFCWDLHGKPREHNLQHGCDLEDSTNNKQLNIECLFSVARERRLLMKLNTFQRMS